MNFTRSSRAIVSHRDLIALRIYLTERVHNTHILDLLGEDSWRNVYAGEPELRPPAAPTTASAVRESGWPQPFSDTRAPLVGILVASGHRFGRFVRVHPTLRMTRAMEAGIADRAESF